MSALITDRSNWRYVLTAVKWWGPCLHRRPKESFSQAETSVQLPLHNGLVLVTPNRNLVQDFQWGLMIKHILALEAKYLGVTPSRHLKVSALKLSVTSETIEFIWFQNIHLWKKKKKRKQKTHLFCIYYNQWESLYCFLGHGVFQKVALNNTQICVLIWQNMIALSNWKN